eukprot:TRINITY_DN778_c0_g1_i4.p1 TRINITY_DN778_c0_g1~~TRINITY_DN778_c0_g1_i4.p1  ORF type:complete len:455 (+),score=84.07 TRINITY_DN778_c0_g1_i4:1310-2674(+)
MPIRWCALESLQTKVFTTKSDVWSFGVCLWESFSYGELPYADLGNNHIQKFIEQGNRLPHPANCPDTIYKIMQKCWEANPNDRYDFHEIWAALKKPHRLPLRMWLLSCDRCTSSVPCLAHLENASVLHGASLVVSQNEPPSGAIAPVASAGGAAAASATVPQELMVTLSATSEYARDDLTASHLTEDEEFFVLTYTFDSPCCISHLLRTASPTAVSSQVPPSPSKLLSLRALEIVPLNMSIVLETPGNIGTKYRYGARCDLCQCVINQDSWVHCADPDCSDFDMCNACSAVYFKQGSAAKDVGTHRASHQTIMAHAFDKMELFQVAMRPEKWITVPDSPAVPVIFSATGGHHAMRTQHFALHEVGDHRLVVYSELSVVRKQRGHWVIRGRDTEEDGGGSGSGSGEGEEEEPEDWLVLLVRKVEYTVAKAKLLAAAKELRKKKKCSLRGLRKLWN